MNTNHTNHTNKNTDASGIPNYVDVEFPQMTDPFVYANQSVNRLVHDYVTHKQIIVAVDFDNTLYDFHKRGFKFDMIVNLVKECQELGFETYIFTANGDLPLVNRVCTELGLNNNGKLKINNASVDFGTRKPFYSILLDDRAGLGEAAYILQSTIGTLKHLDLLEQPQESKPELAPEPKDEPLVKGLTIDDLVELMQINSEPEPKPEPKPEPEDSVWIDEGENSCSNKSNESIESIEDIIDYFTKLIDKNPENFLNLESESDTFNKLGEKYISRESVFHKRMKDYAKNGKESLLDFDEIAKSREKIENYKNNFKYAAIPIVFDALVFGNEAKKTISEGLKDIVDAFNDANNVNGTNKSNKSNEHKGEK